METREFDSKTHIGFKCECISREMRNAIFRGVCTDDSDTCSIKHGWLLGYLVRQSEPVFQKDMEKIFHFPKSTLADIIQSLEKDGLIAKAPVDGDGRKKQIVVTEKGLKFNESAEEMILEVEDFITNGIDPKEFDITVRVLDQIIENARSYKSHKTIKKED